MPEKANHTIVIGNNTIVNITFVIDQVAFKAKPINLNNNHIKHIINNIEIM